MKIIQAILLLVCGYTHISSVKSELEEWTNFKKQFGKTYSSLEEENFHLSIFLQNLKVMEENNKNYANGLSTYTMEINKLADRVRQEKPPKLIRDKTKIAKIIQTDVEVPDSIDWRDYGVITPVVDQLFCNSCWAFAVVAAIEAHNAIYLNKTNQTLSQENLIDCVYSDFSCVDDMEITALEDCYRYIIDNGIATAESYPYDRNVTQCRYNPDQLGATIQDYALVPEGDEEELKKVVGTIGPVSVIISADVLFDLYESGVYYRVNCNDVLRPYNHAVTVIGYGVEDEKDYWLVKNEYGTFFGEEGYIKMARNRDNMCGIASFASYPIVK